MQYACIQLLKVKLETISSDPSSRKGKSRTGEEERGWQKGSQKRRQNRRVGRRGESRSEERQVDGKK